MRRILRLMVLEHSDSVGCVSFAIATNSFMLNCRGREEGGRDGDTE